MPPMIDWHVRIRHANKATITNSVVTFFLFFFVSNYIIFFFLFVFTLYFVRYIINLRYRFFLYFDWLFCICFPKLIKPVFLLRYFIKKNVYKNLFNLKWRCGFTFFRFLEGKNSNLFHENVAFFFPFSV